MTRVFPLALHTWTIDTTPLETALDAAKKGGFDAVELRRSDFVQCFKRGLTKEQAIDLIHKSGAKVGILGTEYGWFFAEPNEQKRLFSVLRETCEFATALGCKMIMSAPGQVVGTIEDAIKATKIAGAIVGEFGLRLALEFNSQHDVVNTTSVLREIIAGAGHANCGMLLDAYHLTRSQGIAQGLEGVTGEEIFLVQYSDVPAKPEIGVRRPVDRLPPGEGIVKWDQFFKLLRDKNYAGYLSYEAPNPALWNRSPYEVAAEGVQKTRILLGQ
jgi:sugar phosphate isomerase/epimerase